MSEVQVRDEVMSILLAGTESTGTALARAFHELASHPEVAARVEAEADKVADAGPVGREDLPRLAYTGQVLHEITRLYAAAVVIRRTLVPVELGGVRQGTALNPAPALTACR